MGLLHEGQIVRGTYEVERLVGEGGFAEVYRVKHRFMGRQAMKVFKMVGMTVKEIEEMLAEAILLSRLHHPNIIHVFDANVTETSKGICGFFTMEYVAGGSLDQFWKSYGPTFVPVETAVEIVRQVCRGLALAHSQNPPIVHRDVKPQNILVGYDHDGLRARLSDFGLAKRANPLTMLVSGRGTPAFKAPEVLKDYNADSCAGDVWALGCTLYLLLTDRLPYTDPESFRRDHARFEQPLVPASRLNAQVGPGLDRILARALAIDRRERYTDAREMLSDLENWKADAPLGGKLSHRVGSPGTDKLALGPYTPPNEEQARQMVAEAMSLAKRFRLQEAADLMEEAFNKWPRLRERYQYRVTLWREGKIC
ncbi:MAG: serine/threonine protein kinase [Candidatus Sumerlaeaceae bacterium]|nr:serine/threonine protein kinase [Candidatus Sumerlaeaceae bacterium]